MWVNMSNSHYSVSMTSDHSIFFFFSNFFVLFFVVVISPHIYMPAQ